MESVFNKAYRFLIYDEMEEYEAVISELTEALDKEPNNIVLLNNRSIAYAEIGRISQAISDIEKAFALDSSSDTIRNNYDSLQEQNEHS